MSIRTIRNSAGTTTGYQAFAGNGGPGLFLNWSANEGPTP